MEEEILNYFNDTFHKVVISGKNLICLKVLDNKYRKYYTGVTLNYICYDLLKAKYRKSDVAKVILKLYENEQIKMLKCPHVRNFVIENKIGNWGTFPGRYNTDNKNYLKQFIKDE